MDKFSFLFSFYGLMLGLAVAELLTGFAGFARRRRIRDLDPLLALLATFVFVDICSIWIDAFDTLGDASLNFEGLLAPILVATCLFLAAAMVFPRDNAEYERIEDYYGRRKTFVAALLIAAEIFLTFTFFGRYERNYQQQPAVFWIWNLPYKLFILTVIGALFVAKGRRANLAVLLAMFAVLAIPYWNNGAFPGWVHRTFDSPADRTKG